ncbi:hypothetical protein [Vibrio coralliilyticus]|uniref:hypothetical protein n=1 Tax=Vibrio coralliilyticus TaxID=190893 RepID=UPI0020A5F220|nr:hypothetical protein [Vibrio coralliilyticus]
MTILKGNFSRMDGAYDAAISCLTLERRLATLGGVLYGGASTDFGQPMWLSGLRAPLSGWGR